MSELGTNIDQTVTNTNEPTEQQDTDTQGNAEIARLRAEMARQKAALDKATKEAGDYKKQLRAKQTAEEAAAETEKEHREAIEKELAELRKEKAVANASKRVMGFVQDEAVATSIAEALYGAEDVDLAIDTINKAWTAREKALRVEYGKIPAPGVGSMDGPTITREQLDKLTLKDRAEFANKHPEEYNRLMGR